MRHSQKLLLLVVLVFLLLQAITLAITKTVLILVLIILVILQILSTWELAIVPFLDAPLVAMLSKVNATQAVDVSTTQWKTLAGDQALALTRSATSFTM